MTNTYIYSSDIDVVRLVQVTDPHLFKDESGELLGINTLASFNQVLTEIQASDFAFDLVLATGDLVQDSSDEGYLSFAERINTLNKPVFWIPGNHDSQPKMESFLTEQYGHLCTKKHLLLDNKWQILMLDSQVFGVPHGKLGQYQLDWLADRLKEYPERYSLIVLHHHILSTNSAWLDQHNLRNSEELAQTLAPFSNVKGILHGHIHQQVDATWNGYTLMSTPSTCVQFKPDCNSFTLDTLQPGWREIELHSNGEIVTRVKRIEQASFLPNTQEDGY